MTTDLLGIARTVGLIGESARAANPLAQTAGFTTTVQQSTETAPFETVVRQTAAERAAASDISPPTAPAAPPAAKNADKARRSFEAFALQVFIGSMLPKENAKLFGTGSAGKLWQSLMAEKLADQIAASGRLKLLPDAAVGGAVPNEQAAANSASGAPAATTDGRKTDRSREIR